MNNKIIVVEGKSDLIKLRELYKDVIIKITGGFSIKKELINELQTLEKENDIILFFDPDYAGESIRRYLKKFLKHPIDVFIDKKLCQDKSKIGVEHANINDIKNVLDKYIDVNKIERKSSITLIDLYKLNLTGTKNSNILRKKICSKLHIFQDTTKGFLKMINLLGYTLDDIKKELNDVRS